MLWDEKCGQATEMRHLDALKEHPGSCEKGSKTDKKEMTGANTVVK